MPLIPKGHTLFVLDLTYTVPLEEAEPYLETHLAFVAEGYDKGWFLASGPKVPRTGGVILAVCDDRSKLEAFLKQDPFCQHAIAHYSVTEFHPRRTADGLE